MAGVHWRKRPFAAAADQEWVERLWRAAMPPSWPMLPAGIALLTEGRVAEAGPHLAGFVAADMAGAISLILVDPACQRRRICTSLLGAALDQVRAGGASSVTAASGGAGYIWPGVPSLRISRWAGISPSRCTARQLLTREGTLTSGAAS